MAAKYRFIVATIIGVVLALQVPGHLEGQGGQFWAKLPPLAGGTSDPTTVNEYTLFSYTVYGTDKDTMGSQQFFDDKVANIQNDIKSIFMGYWDMELQGDDPGAGKRTWVVSGRSRVVLETTVYFDRFLYDDPNTTKADDDPSPWYSKMVTVTNVP